MLEITEKELEDVIKRNAFRTKKFPADQVRKRQSYRWWTKLLAEIKSNTPEQTLYTIHRELRSNGGFSVHRGALVRYKLESLEQVIKDNKNE